MRKRTGLHNKFRRSLGTYRRFAKRGKADKYGQFQDGKQITPDVIGGHQMPIVKLGTPYVL